MDLFPARANQSVCIVIAFILLHAFSVAVDADSVEGTGFFDPSNIPDGGSVFSTITITEAVRIEDISITIEDISHSAVGDLVAELRYLGDGGPTGAFLFFRPNVAGQMVPGSLADLDGSYTFTSQPDDRDFWSETAIPDDDTVDDSLAFFASDADGVFLDLASENFFGGFNTRGEWQLEISDQNSFGNNVGTVTGWTIQFDGAVIPEPSVAGLLGLVWGWWALCRRRCRTVVSCRK